MTECMVWYTSENSTAWILNGEPDNMLLLSFSLATSTITTHDANTLSRFAGISSAGSRYAQHEQHLYAIQGANQTIAVFNLNDPSQDTVTSSIPITSEGSCLTATASSLFVMGGIGLRTLYTLNLTSLHWTSGPSMIHARYDLSCEANRDQSALYAIGGIGDNASYLDSVEMLNVETLTWSLLADTLYRASASHSSVLHNDDILTMGGYSGLRLLSQMNIIDTLHNTISMSGSLDVALTSGAAMVDVAHNVAYLFGGTDQNGDLNSWRFLPLPASTASMTSTAPTNEPSYAPTTEPTSTAPMNFTTTSNSDAIWLSDPFGRLEVSITATVYDSGVAFDGEQLEQLQFCSSCFVWQFKSRWLSQWRDIDTDANDEVSMSNTRTTNDADRNPRYISKLTAQSIRTLNAGHCANAQDPQRLFLPNSTYYLRLLVLETVSPMLTVQTNGLPQNGECAIPDIGDLAPLEPYSLTCAGWNALGGVEYNVLINNVMMNRDFVDDIRNISGIAPAGDTAITVLIKQVGEDSVTCLDIDATFPSIADDADTDEVLSSVQNLIDLVSLAESPDVAVSVHSVALQLYDRVKITPTKTASLIDQLVSEIAAGTDGSDGAQLINALAALSLITSCADCVDFETTGAHLIDSFYPSLFETIEVLLAAGSSPETMYSIAMQSQMLIVHLENSLDASDADINAQIQTLVDYATLSAAMALSLSNIGEVFLFESAQYAKVVLANKFLSDANVESAGCGTELQSVSLPQTFLSEHSGEFDCVFIAASTAFVPDDADRVQTSQVVTIDIYEQHDATRRRRMPSAIETEHETDLCFPYLITLGLLNASTYDETLQLDETSSFPACDSWNVNDWDASGCFVYDMANDSVTCACTHLSSFSVSDDNIVLEANRLTEVDQRRLTWSNLMQYPTVWLTSALMLVLILTTCWLDPRSSTAHTLPAIAMEDIIFESQRNESSVLWRDIAGKEIACITAWSPAKLGFGILAAAETADARRSLWKLQLSLFRTYLCNDHTLISVFQRSAGTNFSLKARLGCFFMYLGNIMMVTGIFYGRQQPQAHQDMLVSLIISLCGTLPVLIVRKTFEKSKPMTQKSERTELLQHTQRMTESGLDSGLERGREGSTPMTTLSPAENAILDSFDMKECSRHAMQLFTDEVMTAYATNKAVDKKARRIAAASELRQMLLDEMYPLPHGCRTTAWVLLIGWSAISVLIAILFGLQFDIEMAAEDTVPLDPHNENFALYANEQCWNTSLRLRIESNLSTELLQAMAQQRELDNGSSYGGSDSASWLLSILQSLITSMLVWQPLTVFIVTFLKIWCWCWHLKMKVGPGNLWLLCQRCCCGYDPSEEGDGPDLDDAELNVGRKISKLSYRSFMAGKRSQNSREKANAMVAHRHRPVDMIAFLGSKAWIIDDTKDGLEKKKPQNNIAMLPRFSSCTPNSPGSELHRVIRSVFEDDECKGQPALTLSTPKRYNCNKQHLDYSVATLETSLPSPHRHNARKWFGDIDHDMNALPQATIDESRAMSGRTSRDTPPTIDVVLRPQNSKVAMSPSNATVSPSIGEIEMNTIPKSASRAMSRMASPPSRAMSPTIGDIIEINTIPKSASRGTSRMTSPQTMSPTMGDIDMNALPVATNGRIRQQRTIDANSMEDEHEEEGEEDDTLAPLPATPTESLAISHLVKSTWSVNDTVSVCLDEILKEVDREADLKENPPGYRQSRKL